MLDFETVFLSRAQWETQGKRFGLRSWHGFGSSGTVTPDGEKLTIEEGKQWFIDNIAKHRLIMWQENYSPAKKWDGWFMWLEHIDESGEAFKVDLDLVYKERDNEITTYVYRVLDQECFNKIKKYGLFNFAPNGFFDLYHFIGPNDPVPELKDIEKYCVFFVFNDKSKSFDGSGLKEIALFDSYEDAKMSCDGLNKMMNNPEITHYKDELKPEDGCYIISDVYPNKRSYSAYEKNIFMPTKFYIERYEELKKLHS